MRKFTGIDFMTEAVPDETTLCKFRHLLEENGLNKLFFDAINRDVYKRQPPSAPFVRCRKHQQCPEFRPHTG